MDSLHFKDYDLLVEDIIETSTLAGSDFCIVAKYEDVCEILKILVPKYSIMMINLANPDLDYYFDEYYIAVQDGELWCMEAYNINQECYDTEEADIFYVFDNVNSKILRSLRSGVVYEVSIGEEVKKPKVKVMINGKEASSDETLAAIKEVLKEYCDYMDYTNEYLSEIDRFSRLLKL